MKSLATWLAATFGRTTPATVANEHLHQAQLDLLRAHAELEHWKATVPMLEARVRRLKAGQVDNGVASVTSIAASR